MYGMLAFMPDSGEAVSLYRASTEREERRRRSGSHAMRRSGQRRHPPASRAGGPR